MAMLSWSKTTMGTGVDSVDAQHQELIKMLNQLMDASKQGKGNDEIGKMLDFLGDYVKTHFTHEEQVMARLKCPSAAENKKQHEMFLKDLVTLRQKFDADGAGLAFLTLVQQKVVNWLLQHISKCDARLNECTEKVGM